MTELAHAPVLIIHIRRAPALRQVNGLESLLTRPNRHVLRKRGRWVHNDGFSDLQARKHLSRLRVALSDLNDLPDRPSTIDFERAPLLRTPEQRAYRHARHIHALPDDDSALHAIAVAQPSGRRSQVGHHMHALLLHAER